MATLGTDTVPKGDNPEMTLRLLPAFQRRRAAHTSLGMIRLETMLILIAVALASPVITPRTRVMIAFFP